MVGTRGARMRESRSNEDWDIERIRLVNEQFAHSPRYIELAWAKRWNGALPTTVLDDGATPRLSLK